MNRDKGASGSVSCRKALGLRILAVASKNSWRGLAGAGLVAIVFVGPSLAAKDLVDLKFMSMEMARDLAQGAVEACRDEGFQVSAVVVDRSATPQVVMRDLYAARFTLDIAEKKANAVILSGVSTREFLDNRPDLTPVLNHMEPLLVLQGGIPIRAAGSLVGALGVSGAPGGDIDERCALKALEKVSDRLEFADF